MLLNCTDFPQIWLFYIHNLIHSNFSHSDPLQSQVIYETWTTFM